MDNTDAPADERAMSLELGDLAELFESDRFPVTTEELVEEYGDETIGYPDGEERLESILETSGNETYETADQLEMALLNGVSRDAVGRPEYSDRGDELDGDGSRTEQSL